MLPLLAVLGSVTALGIGTSFAKQLFPLIGSMGTTAVRVGFSALLLLALWRPWRWPLSRRDAGSIARYGAALGLMNLLFYLALRSIPFGLAVAIEFAGPLTVALLSSRRAVDFVWLLLAVCALALLLPVTTGAASLDPLGVGYVGTAAAARTSRSETSGSRCAASGSRSPTTRSPTAARSRDRAGGRSGTSTTTRSATSG